VTVAQAMLHAVTAVQLGETTKVLRIRVGVHSGALIAGVVGVDRLAFGASAAKRRRGPCVVLG